MATREQVVAVAAMLMGCGPGLVASEVGEEESSTHGDGDPGDGDPGDGDGEPGDGEPGDGDGDGDPGDGDGQPGDGDGDGDPVCRAWESLCPDNTCQQTFNDPYACCGHDGECLAGCEPQDASSTESECADPLYAWTGAGCKVICECEGSECGSLYESVGACLGAHEPTCGTINLGSCPFETPLGPTDVAGMTSEGPRSYAVGAFGPIHGEGPVYLNIVLARDAVTLGNHLWKEWDPPKTADVLKIWGAVAMPGEYEISISMPIPSPDFVQGTLTITNVVLDGQNYLGYGLWATLDVSEAEWELHGEFAIPGCQTLAIYLP